MSFNDVGEFEQVLEPYPTGDCDDNTITWDGIFVQANQTFARMDFVRCEQSGPGCLNCTPTGDRQIEISFRGDCTAFTYRDQDIQDPERTYYLTTAASNELPHALKGSVGRRAAHSKAVAKADAKANVSNKVSAGARDEAEY